MQRVKLILVMSGLPFVVGLALGVLLSMGLAPAPSGAVYEAAETTAEEKRVVAKVGEQGVRRKEFYDALRREAKKRETDVAKLGPSARAKVMEELIDRELIFQEALRQGMPRDKFIQDRIVNEFANNWINRQIDPKSFPEDEVRQYYDEHPEEFKAKYERRVSQIVVEVSMGAPEALVKDARNKALFVHRKVQEDPSRWNALVDEYSEQPRKQPGGDVGWVGEKYPIAGVWEAVSKLAVGEISEVTRTQFGFHIFYVTEERGGEVTPYKDARARAVNRVIRVRQRSLRKSLLEQLRSQTAVDVDDDSLRERF